VRFTQYILPHGRKRTLTINRPFKVEEKARQVEVAGGRFEVEILRSGEVSLTVAYEDEDIAIELVPNDASVPPAVDRLVDAAFEKLVTS